MGNLAFTLSSSDRPILDFTGAPGVYDFDLRWEPYGDVERSSEPAGFKLEPCKIPMDLYVIDRAEEVPVET